MGSVSTKCYYPQQGNVTEHSSMTGRAQWVRVSLLQPFCLCVCLSVDGDWLTTNTKNSLKKKETSSSCSLLISLLAHQWKDLIPSCCFPGGGGFFFFSSFLCGDLWPSTKSVLCQCIAFLFLNLHTQCYTMTCPFLYDRFLENIFLNIY